MNMDCHKDIIEAFRNKALLELEVYQSHEEDDDEDYAPNAVEGESIEADDEKDDENEEDEDDDGDASGSECDEYNNDAVNSEIRRTSSVKRDEELFVTSL